MSNTPNIKTIHSNFTTQQKQKHTIILTSIYGSLNMRQSYMQICVVNFWIGELSENKSTPWKLRRTPQKRVAPPATISTQVTWVNHLKAQRTGLPLAMARTLNCSWEGPETTGNARDIAGFQQRCTGPKETSGAQNLKPQ